MFIELIFKDPTVVMLFFVLIHLFLFYALGAIVQEYFSFKKYNRFLSIPIGYVSWTLLSIVVFIIPTIFQLDMIWFNLSNTIKDIITLFIVILYYEAWFPSFKDINVRGLIRAPIGIGIIILALGLFFILNKFTNWGIYNEDFINGINAIVPGNVVFNTGFESNIVSSFERYESLYYWIAILSHDSKIITMTNFMNIMIPAILIVVVSCIVLGTTIDSEKTLISYLYSALILMFIVIVMAFIGVNNQAFYSLPMVVMSFMLMFEYSNHKNPNDNLLTTSLITLLTMFAVTEWAIPLLVILGLLIVSLSIIKEGSIVKTMYRYISVIAVPAIGYTILSFVSTILGAENITFGSQFTNMLVVIIMFTIIIIPLRSLARSNNRRGDLVSFETKVKEKKYISLLWTALIISILSFLLLLLFIGGNPINKTLKYFEAISDKVWVSILVYLCIIILPTAAIIYVDTKFKYKSVLSMIPYFTIMMNPVTFALITELGGEGGWIYDWKLLILPEIVIFFLWGIGELIKFIPERLKI